MSSDSLLTDDLPALIQTIQQVLEGTNYTITPKLIQQLRSILPLYDQEQVSQLLDIALATHRAKSIAEYAPIMPWYFTEQTLMQSSEPAFADHVINTLNVQGHTYIEICTGAGMHACSALKQGAHEVITYEVDEFIASMTKLNARLHGMTINPLCTDGGKAQISPREILFADPSRRTSGKERSSLIGIYSPNLSQLIEMAGRAKRGGIKIAPGERIEGEFTREFLGWGRECREQILWFNTEVIDGTVTLIDKQKTFTPIAKGSVPRLISCESQTLDFLLEPHPALIRGDLTSMYVENDIAVIDRSIAYGISTVLHDADWFTHFRILQHEKYSRRRLQECIYELGWSRLTEIKKRGFPIEPDSLRKQLKFREDAEVHGVIILTRIENEHHMFFCERI